MSFLTGRTTSSIPTHISRLSHRSLSTSIKRCADSTPSTSSNSSPNDPTWTGRKSSEHVANRDDTHNIQSSASKAGRDDRAAGDQGTSGATTEKDEKELNSKAKDDHPEAPGPVIGMNDERGGVGH